MKNIQTLLKDLTPQQKIELLNKELGKTKKKKDKQQIFTLIDKAKQEQTLLEESIQELEVTREEPDEEPLEQIVAQAQPESEEEKKQQPKPQDLYGVEKLQSKYLSPNETKKEEYKASPDLPSHAFTMREEEQNLINTQEQQLRKERKKYEAGGK